MNPTAAKSPSKADASAICSRRIISKLVGPHRNRTAQGDPTGVATTCRSRQAPTGAVSLDWPYNRSEEQNITKVSTANPKRRRSRRLEVRTTPEEREIIDRAVKAAGIDLTTFVITSLTVSAQRVLADRTVFALNAEASQAWEAINRRPAREIPGLLDLMERPSPFVKE